MASWTVLSQTLSTIQAEMRSTKYTVRSKAIERLQSILDNRNGELAQLLSGSILSVSSGTSWSDLFDTAHESCIQQITNIESKTGQAGVHLIVNKTRDHATVIQKIITNANAEFNRIPFVDILGKCFHCFSNRHMVQHFGMCYLQIVQQQLLGGRANLEDVKISDWSQLLSYCFQMYDNKHVQKLTVLKCLTPIVANGSTYTYLSNDLVQYLPKLKIIAESNLEFVGLTELISSIFCFCSNLALDYRLTVCDFLESSLGVIIKSYGARMTDEAKIILFKLLNVAIVLHSPEGNFDGKHTSYAVNQNEWNKHLRQILYLVQKEIQRSKTQTYRSENNPTICKRLVMLGASLCSVIFWNSSVWADAVGGESAEPAKKRKRQADGLIGVMELVEFEKGQFCWRWLSILSELITEHPQALQPNDLQPLLQLLQDFQATIKYPVQIQILTQICKALVAEEARLCAETTTDRCHEFWYKIAQTAFRTSASFNLVLAENLRLIRLLITHKHRSFPNTFLCTVLQTIVSRQIPKSNEAVQVACTILRSCNVEVIGDGAQLRNETLAWLYAKRTADSMCETEAMQLKGIAELSVLCVFTKIDTDLVDANSADTEADQSHDDYQHFMSVLKRNLLYKSMNRLIVLEIDAMTVKNEQRLPQPNQLKSVINEQHFEKLFNILAAYDRFELTDNHASDFLAVAASLKLRLRLLDELLLYESLDSGRIEDTFLHKQIGLNLDYLELCVQRYSEQSPSVFAEKESMDMVNNMFSLLVSTKHHTVLERRVNDHPFASTIAWLKAQTHRSKCSDSQTFSMHTLTDLNCDHQVRYRALAVLAHFAAGKSGRDAFTAIGQYEFNFNSNTDLFMVLKLTKTIIGQTPSAEKAEWAFDNIKKICTMYHRNQCVSERLIDLLPDFFCFIRTYASMTNDMIMVVSSFLSQTRKKKYGPQLTCKLIRSLRSLAQVYPLQLNTDSFAAIFRFLGTFLKPQHTLAIQYATIETLSYVFDADWIKQNDHAMLSLKHFHCDLFQHLEIDKLLENSQTAINDATGDVDQSSRTISLHIQLFSAIICKCYILRKDSWFLLAELCYRSDISKQCITAVILMLCTHLNIEHTTIITENIVHLLGKWLIKNYQMAKFPWYLTPCHSQSDFFYDYLATVTMSILKYRPKILEDFVTLMPGETMQSIMEPVLPNCLGYLTPLFAKCDHLPLAYKTMGADIYSLLQANFNNLDAINEAKIVQILQHLLQNVWDGERLRDMFGFDIDFDKEDHMIDVAQFKRCLEFVQDPDGAVGGNQRLIVSYCLHHPLRVYQLLQSLKVHMQTTRFVEQKIVYLFQFTVIVADVMDYLVHEQVVPKVKKDVCENCKAFFMQDIVYALCNILMDADGAVKLKQATCHYLHRFCVAVLPKCAKLFGGHLNYVVSALVPLAAEHDERALLCLRLLVVTNREPMAKFIAILENFPIASVFDEMRRVHMDIKYGGKAFTLADELKYFFEVPKRKAEGFAALRNHLSMSKDELAAMYKSHRDAVAASGDYETSGLYRLIMALLSAIQGSDPAKSMEAAKCLGELGPSDLVTIVLNPDNQTNACRHFATLESAIKNMCHVALSKLVTLLLHPDARVLKAASEAIIFLLKYTVGQSFVDEYPTLVLFRSPVPRATPMFSIANGTILDLQIVFDEEKLSSHVDWLKRLVIELLSLFGDKHLKNAVSTQLLFAETMLPLLVQMLLAYQVDCYQVILRDVVVMFFTKHVELVRGQSLPDGMAQSIYLNRACIKAMLNICECMRIYNLNNLSKKITLNHLDVGKAALYCDAYFTAIMYVELWVLETTAEINNKKEKISDPMLQNVMKEAYKALGKNDAVMPFLNPITDHHTHLELSGSWNRLIIEPSYQQPDTVESYRNCIMATGLFRLANSSPQTTVMRQPNGAEYECMWRLCDWSAINDIAPSSVALADDHLHVFEREHYQALKCLQIKDEMGAKASIESARLSVIGFLRHASLECTNNIYRHLTRLSMIQQIEDFCQVQFYKSEPAAAGNQNIFEKWKLQDRIGYTEFQFAEPILAQRVTIFKSAGVRATRKLQNTFNVGADVLPSMILNLAVASRYEGKLNLATRYLAILKTMPINNEIRSKLWLEDAQLSWHLGDQEQAKKLLRITLTILDVESAMTRARALRIFGESLAESNADTLQTLLDKFFNSSLTLLDNIDKSSAGIIERIHISVESMQDFLLDNRILAYESIAKYSDREYQRLNGYMRTTLYAQKVERQKLNAQTIAEMAATSMTLEMRRSQQVLKNFTEIDRHEIQTTEAEREQYLRLAVHNYVKASTMKSDSSSSVMFRIISLWFSNKKNAEISRHLQEHFSAIASYNFVPVLPQIVARISDGLDEFNRTVLQVIERCAIDHPHHTIYHVLALVNAHLDDTSNLRKNPEPRVLGAKKLLFKLCANQKISLIASQMQDMCTAMIDLANKDIKGSRISSKETLRKLKNLTHVHCPTLNLALSKDGNYSNLISVVKWSETMTMVGGINAPKKVSCLCSNGIEYPQLLKGKDDLRQDAIMQQVFTILNGMLQSQKEAKQRRLNVKTYRVVPLSQRSGVLEWCSNSVPLSDYLVGSAKNPGAHQRYHPDDLKPTECRSAVHTANQNKMPLAQKLELYKKTCAKFRPAFQYFFFERFPKPGEWFERRLAYTNSVATTSMIGYILGIGDRHVSNILIDEKTAELIHIDFGIAFEQAKCLPTPETIPFRLTRDIVAPFGVSGVDGIFRKSCEITMEVLRTNKTTIVTILEVLLYDPLYAWAMTAKKAYSVQNIEMAGNDANDQKNSMAERALCRLEAKLNGNEEGTAGGTWTIEAHIEWLITQAVSQQHLCRLFSGWQAYL